MRPLVPLSSHDIDPNVWREPGDDLLAAVPIGFVFERTDDVERDLSFANIKEPLEEVMQIFFGYDPGNERKPNRSFLFYRFPALRVIRQGGL